MTKPYHEAIKCVVNGNMDLETLTTIVANTTVPLGQHPELAAHVVHAFMSENVDYGHILAMFDGLFEDFEEQIRKKIKKEAAEKRNISETVSPHTPATAIGPGKP